MNKEPPTPSPFLASGWLAFLALLASVVAQMGYKLDPCFLCTLQRIAFGTILGTSLIAILLNHRRKFIWFLRGISVIGLGIALYQTSLEYGLLQSGCKLPQTIQDFEAFSSMLDSASCSTSNWKILGLPVSVLSSILFTCVGLITFLTYNHHSSKKYLS